MRPLLSRIKKLKIVGVVVSHIIVKDIHKSYKRNRVLNGLSFECKNEIVFIAGKNGTGKTTFIRLALGLDKEDKGSIDFESFKILLICIF